MNPEAQAELDRITRIDPKDLSFDDRAFLRSRASYLKKSQVEEYKEVLEMTETRPVEGTENEEPFITYPELLRKAKELGYSGGRAKRPQLEAYIKDQETQKNPFN